MAPEAKVGALFLLAVLLIAGIVIFLGQYAVGIGQYPLVVHFADVKGLAAGAEVRLAGVKIGKVTAVGLERYEDYPDRPVAVHIMIDQQVTLYDTDEFIIELSGVIGEQYLNVNRLSAEQIAQKYGEGHHSRALGAGEHRPGKGVIGFGEVASKTQQLLEQADQTLKQIQNTFADTYTRKQVRTILQNINKATAQTNLIAEQVLHLAEVLTKTAETGQPQVTMTLDTIAQTAQNLRKSSQQIQGMITALTKGPIPKQIALTTANIHAASKDIKATTELVRESVEGPAGASRISELLESLTSASRNVEQLTSQLEELIGDGQIAGDLKATLANLRTTSESLKAISGAAEEFLLDEETMENIETSVRNIRELSEEGAKTARAAQGVLQRVDNTMDKLGSMARPFQPSHATAYWSLEGTENRGLRADLNLRLRYGDNSLDYWRLGLRDLGGHETLNLQKSVPLSRRLWGEVGLLESEIAAGLNYRMTPELRWELEAYDPDDINIDLRGIYQAYPDWYFTFGIADSFDRNQPFVGLEYRTNLTSQSHSEE